MIGLYPFVRIPNLLFGNTKWFRLIHQIPPWLKVDPWVKQDNVTPSLQLHYRAFITTTSDSAPVLRIGTLPLMGASHLRFSLHIGATGSHVPHRSLDQARATFTPDITHPVSRLLVSSSQDNHPTLVLMPTILFDASSMVHLRSSS